MCFSFVVANKLVNVATYIYFFKKPQNNLNYLMQFIIKVQNDALDSMLTPVVKTDTNCTDSSGVTSLNLFFSWI